MADLDIPELTKQNPWWINAKTIENDPKIVDFEQAAVQWIPRLKKCVRLDRDVIYMLRGPRQVGKTTFAKLLFREELKKRRSIDLFYFSCDLLSSSIELKEVIEKYLSWSSRQSQDRKTIILDEISRVKDWELAIKHIVDLYALKNKTFILSGSSSWDLKHGIERLPGRKGELTGGQSQKILLPMKFSEYLGTRNPDLYNKIEEIGIRDHVSRKTAFKELLTGHAQKWLDRTIPYFEELDYLFEEYLLTGGIMTAVNQFCTKKEIPNSVYELYLQFFFGDLAKLMREETTAKKVISAIIKHKGQHIGWIQIAKEMDIKNVLTVMQYSEILHNLFAINIYHAFDQNTKVPMHRSEKKLQIFNPFFFHAFKGYVEDPSGSYFGHSKEFIQKSENKAFLCEYVCGDHLSRLSYGFASTDLFDQQTSVFYVRTNKGETVDFITRLGSEFIPVEVKYQNQINHHDYSGINKFPTGIIASKKTFEERGSHVALPLPILLLFV